MPEKRRNKDADDVYLRNQLAVLIAVKEANERRTYTRAEIAKAAGVSLDSLNRLINNQTDRYDGRIVVKLCEWLGVKPATFFGDDYKGFSIPLSVNASMAYAAGAAGG